VEDRRFLTRILMVQQCHMGHNKQLSMTGLPSEMPLNTSRMGVSSCPPNGVVEDRRFLMTVLMQSLCPEDDFRLLKFSKSLFLA